MAQFTVVTDSDVRALAAAVALGELVAWSPIAAGTINTNLDVRTDRGRFFVRVNEGKSEADVAWESRLVAALAAAGVATPPPIVAPDGRPYASFGRDDKWVSAFPWRAGHHLAAHEVDPTTAHRLGAALAALHVAALALPASWQRASIYDHAHLVARHASFAGSDDPQLVRAIHVLADALAAAGAAASQRAAATHGIIHGDLFRDNVLWANGQIIALLDFEQASGGSLAYDLAVVINDWCWGDGAPRFDLVAAVIAGYQSVRPLPAADRAALPIEVRAAAARFTITRITDVYLARAANPEKDFRDYLARVEAWQGRELGQLTSSL